MNAEPTKEQHALDRINFRVLYKSLFRYRPAIRQIVVLYLLWTLFELALPFLTKILVDQGIGFGDVSFIGLILLAQFMLVVGNISSDIFKTWLMRHIGVRLNLQVVDGYFQKLIAKTVRFFSKNNEGTLHQHVNDNLRIEKFLTEGSMSLLNAVFKLTLFSAIMLIFDWRIGLLFIGSVGLLLAWDVAFLGRRARADEDRFQISSQLRGELIEVVHGINDIKVNGLEQQRVLKWYALQDHISRVRLKLFGIAQYYQGGTVVIAHVRDLLVIFVSAISVVNGSMTLGALLAIQYLLGHSNKPTLDIVQFIQDYHDAKLSLGRLQGVYEDNEAEQNGETLLGQVSGEIELSDVHFRYNPEALCLEGITATIKAGKKVALVGESGCGKSTLMKLLLKLQSPNSGDIMLDGVSLSNYANESWRSNCSIVLQDGILFEGTVRYNITLKANPDDGDDARIYEALQICALEDVVKALPHGLDTFVGYQRQNLSKGQSQRLLMARAVYNNGDVVLLDEPTSAMDSVTAHTVTNNLLGYFSAKTMIMATHNLQIARMMDEIILMRNGVIHSQGNPEEVLAQLELSVKA